VTRDPPNMAPRRNIILIQIYIYIYIPQLFCIVSPTKLHTSHLTAVCIQGTGVAEHASVVSVSSYGDT
jgi:hypothetical protein